MADGLISTEDLAVILGQPHTKVLDASFALDGAPPYAKFELKHIPGAQFFDIDEIADPKSPLPRTLPPAEQFSRQVSALGISNSDLIVIYDQTGVAMAASRAWWMFKTFGHGDVAVLDGGLPKWLAESRPVDSGPAAPPRPGKFVATFHPELVASANDVLNNIETQAYTHLDARSAERFAGTAAEPRPGMAPGHVPNSTCIPYTTFLNPDKTFKSPQEISEILKGRGFEKSKKYLLSCGSGVTACVDALALYLAGYKNITVYDGSWAEWGANPNYPKTTGA